VPQGGARATVKKKKKKKKIPQIWEKTQTKKNPCKLLGKSLN